MARMIPAREYTDFHDSNAEKHVFDDFQQQLPDAYKVFHSEDWFRAPGQSLSDQNRGEIDFLVAHKEKGLLVLEIKGGGIEYNPETDTWWTINDEGRDRLDKSPAKQANAGMYNLLNRIQANDQLTENGNFPGVLGWGLFFPDLREADAGVFPDMDLPAERILYREDRDDLEASMEQLYDFWDSQRYDTGPLNGSQWQALTGTFLRREFRVVETLGNYIDKSEQRLVRMTEQQLNLLDFLRNKRDVFVRGCAGSGKTLLSLEKARRLADRGQRVLWLCYNRDLRHHVEEQMEEEDVEISHFHSFAMQLFQESPVEFSFPETDEEWSQFFDDEVPELLSEAAQYLDREYDALILDEGQDFRDEWFMSLLDLTIDDKWLYVFYDPNQSIYGEVPGWLEEWEREFYPLNTNVRNTEQIGRASVELGDIEDEIRFGPSGKPVRVDVTDTKKEIVDSLRQAVHELFVEGDLDPHQAVILTRHSRGNSPLADVDKLGNYRIVKSSSGGNRNQILHSTIKSYKGLEADIVLMVIPEWEDEHARAVLHGRLPRETSALGFYRR